MPIQRGDFVRPSNDRSLPQGSVWRVICSAGALKLEPENDVAKRVERSVFDGFRFSAQYFDKVVLCRGQWVDAREAICLREPASFVVDVMTERKAELQAAERAKAKADKEAAAKAKAEEAKRQLAARLHADRCLGEATLELIAEVSRLNNGGSEHVAHSSIADHVDQLQALAKSYGYRIAKPSMLAQVVKL